MADAAVRESATADHVTIKPHAHGFGAEISGIRIADGITDAEFAVIHQAFLDHKVLIFRDQPLEDAPHQAFAARFGEVDGHINKSTRQKGMPNVQVFSNVLADGKTTGVHPEKGTLVWHTDKSYTATPSLTTVLRSPAIASKGGNTLFADTARAYDALPEETKSKLAGLRAVHDWGRSRLKSGERPATEEEMAAAPPVEHPIVRTHPETGRKAIYVGNHASHVVGKPVAEGEVLLAELEAHATKPEFVYRHKWQVNDVLMWDNRCTMHCVEPYDAAKEKRAVHRVVVKGDKPF
jgi:alpha-ketoglutarate-dependent taurine dioxygenase